MKSQKENELDVARSKFIRAFNFVTGILRMKRLSRKVALGLALILIGGRASVRNASISFGLNHASVSDKFLGRNQRFLEQILTGTTSELVERVSRTQIIE